jgi:5-histidylcysteine sulfoxide synthase/putative 4-mercaptohistidine N1-methyltranferase
VKNSCHHPAAHTSLDDAQTSALPAPTRTLWLQGDNVATKRQELLDYFIQTYDLYDSLFDCLAHEDAWFKKAISLRHPLIFYYGHTASFFINKLFAAQQINQRINAKIEAMVAIGVDEMSWDDLDETHYNWPTIAELRAYRQQVKTRVIQFIQDMPLELPISWGSPAWTILMGIEHERIHLETSSVLIRQLPLSLVKSQPRWQHCPHARQQPNLVPTNELLPVAATTIQMGKPDSDATYGWDNEYGQREIKLDTFQASKYLVSNAEFIEFVLAGGYQHPEWWSTEGQEWLKFTKANKPTFWQGDIQQPDILRLRLMTEEIAMPWDWPVETNQLEAAAFCRWKAAQTGLPIQLPCEAEWMALRQTIACDQPDWQQAPGNINLEYWSSSSPIDQFPQGDFCDVIGNVWQWTSTAIDGFDGFRVHPLYDDFSTPTFDGKHNLIKGGSWISTGNLALKNSRYAFRRHFFQHAGFRYVVSRYQEPLIVNPYETDPLIAEYLDSHYGAGHFNVPNHCQRLAEIAAQICQQPIRALDIGCSVGRTSFELAKYFQHVDAVDYSARFIDIAQTLAQQYSFRYAIPTEGELVEYREAKLTDCQLDPELASRIHFTQGDACNLKGKYQHYDLILAANILDRLREPKHFLADLAHRLRDGGILMLCSPYTWQVTSTSKHNWLGGIRENGEALTTYQYLQRALGTEFEELQPAQDIPFVLQETARKYQYLLSQLTIWQKK